MGTLYSSLNKSKHHINNHQTNEAVAESIFRSIPTSSVRSLSTQRSSYRDRRRDRERSRSRDRNRDQRRENDKVSDKSIQRKQTIFQHSQSKRCNIFVLSTDVHYVILLYLDYLDLVTMLRVNKYFFNVGLNPNGQCQNYLWKKLPQWMIKCNDANYWNITKQTIRSPLSMIKYAHIRKEEMIASASLDHSVRLWSADGGVCVKELTGHTEYVQCVCFHPHKSELLASCSNDKTVKIWNLSTDIRDDTQRCIRTIIVNAPVRTVHWHPVNSDEILVVSGYMMDKRSTVMLYNTENSQSVKEFKGHTDWVCTVKYSNHAKLLVTGGYDKTARIWNADTAECVTTLVGHTSFVLCVLFTADNQHIVSSSQDLTIKLWRVRDGQCVCTLSGHQGGVNSLCLSNSEMDPSHSPSLMLASASSDRTIRLWRVGLSTRTNDFSFIRAFSGHTACVDSVVFTADNNRLISCSDDMSIRIWQVSDGSCLKNLTGHSNSVNCISLSQQSVTP